MELVRDPLLDAVTALASARDEAAVCNIVRRAARELTAADGVTFVLRKGNYDGSMTRRQGGLGLGLAIVREIMSLHGGAVRAESAGKDQGTTIYLEFAVAEEPRPSSEVLGHTLRAKAPVH